MPELGEAGDAALWVLFALVLGDSLGVPVPGDAALIIAGGLAAKGTLSLPAVIVVASVAAFVGDLIAFEAGRRGGRRVLERDGRFADHRRRVLVRADRFYARHGLVAVYVAKFVPGVRAVSAVTAGATSMPRGAFAAVNAFAVVSWTSLSASVAYALGPEGSLYLVVVGGALTAIVVIVAMARRRRAALAPATLPAAAAPAATGGSDPG